MTSSRSWLRTILCSARIHRIEADQGSQVGSYNMYRRLPMRDHFMRTHPFLLVQRAPITKTQCIYYWIHTSPAKYLNNIFNKFQSTTTFIVTVCLSKMTTPTKPSSLECLQQSQHLSPPVRVEEGKSLLNTRSK